MTAIVFALTALENGRRLGHAVVCADARYASVRWHGANRVDRRFLSPQSWIAVLHALSDTLEPGPLPADGPISVALLPEGRRRSIIVQYLYAVPVAEEVDVVRQLDALLGESVRPVLRME